MTENWTAGKILDRAGTDSVFALIFLMLWVDAIRRGNLLDFSAIIFALFAVRIYRRFQPKE